ncbi:hypothetical protein GCM10010452_29360 [Crossiella cryophila]
MSSAVLGAAAVAQAAPAEPPIPAEIAPAGVTAKLAAPGRVAASPLLCTGHAVEHGNWNNADPNATGIARAELRDCQSVTVCEGSICRIVHDAGWTMRLFGKCSPTNCDWGWSNSEFRQAAGHIHAFYDHGFAKRHVWAKMSQYRPGQLGLSGEPILSIRTGRTTKCRNGSTAADAGVTNSTGTARRRAVPVTALRPGIAQAGSR